MDGRQVAQGLVPKARPYAFSDDEGADGGVNMETIVSPDDPQGLGNAFTGTTRRVTVELVR